MIMPSSGGLNCYYVDKTPFLKTIFEDDHNSVLLITRPRRFGKTLTMSCSRVSYQ